MVSNMHGRPWHTLRGGESRVDARTQQRVTIHAQADVFKDVNGRLKGAMVMDGPGIFPVFAIAPFFRFTGNRKINPGFADSGIALHFKIAPLRCFERFVFMRSSWTTVFFLSPSLSLSLSFFFFFFFFFSFFFFFFFFGMRYRAPGAPPATTSTHNMTKKKKLSHKNHHKKKKKTEPNRDNSKSSAMPGHRATSSLPSSAGASCSTNTDELWASATTDSKRRERKSPRRSGTTQRSRGGRSPRRF